MYNVCSGKFGIFARAKSTTWHLNLNIILIQGSAEVRAYQ